MPRLYSDRRRIRALAFMAAIGRTGLHWNHLESVWMEFVTSGGMVCVVPS